MSALVHPLAHETWFVPDPAGSDWAFAAQPLTLGLLLGAGLATLLVRVVGARWSGLHVPFLARMAPRRDRAVAARAGPLPRDAPRPPATASQSI